MDNPYQEAYKESRGTLISGIIFLTALFLIGIAGAVVLWFAPFPVLLLGLLYLLGSVTGLALLGPMAWDDYQKFQHLRDVIQSN